MFKKTAAALAVAGLLVLGGAGAASADYPADAPVTASDTTPTVGQTVTITANDLGDYSTVTFTVSPTTGASLASIVLASSGGSVSKPVNNGSASASFTATTAGTYVVTVSGEGALGSVTLNVAAAGSGSGGSGQLPATGGEVPGAIIWLGVGAIGLGGIAVAAAVARRRAAGSR
ncbi:LPXTG-motif cell wall-anchored protein [Microbacterium trichothecenolyticum]|uniref:LPXTG cell wall anchor domain-containing protein n=1 Tax=Microbacterium trichothecenolyticum TaxID=69370 RepID=UPI002863D3A9|nr:LPXTG cell wall anchor domain-containing protein [Microbacterium trichothecenolyticum]MDR7112938.1 LPXTG-motif cell wall-anchored protein [Microbacterium trichothecenolyticum]